MGSAAVSSPTWLGKLRRGALVVAVMAASAVVTMLVVQTLVALVYR